MNSVTAVSGGINHYGLIEWPELIGHGSETASRQLLLHHERDDDWLQEPRANARLLDRQQNCRAGRATPDTWSSEKILAIAVGVLGQRNGREYPNFKPSDLRSGGCADIDVCIINGKGKFAWTGSPAGQVDRPDRNHTGNESPGLDGDALTFELLIE
jgi:hypothetical protein